MYLYGTLLSSTGQMAHSLVHTNLLLAHWLSLWYTTIFYWHTGPPHGTLLSSPDPFAHSYGHYNFYWATGCLCGKLLSPTGPLAVFMVHYHLLLAHWPSLLYTTILYWPTEPNASLRYTAIFYWPTGYLYGTLPSSSCALAISMVHYYHLLAHWLSL